MANCKKNAGKIENGEINLQLKLKNEFENIEAKNAKKWLKKILEPKKNSKPEKNVKKKT